MKFSLTPRRLLASTGTAPGMIRRGFTLLETSMALVIIGVGVLAFVEAQQSFIRNNGWSSQAATGAYLANEIRELSRRLPRHDPVVSLYLDTENGGALAGWGLEGNESDISDINDIDDLDGISFGLGGFEGPINALGELVPATDENGVVVVNEDGMTRAMTGWFQSVTVEKLDPLNFGTVRADNFVIGASGNDPGTPIDGFPLRVTVVVSYQGPLDSEPVEITRTSWVVPP
ncbi:MAG: prepilin-type N-terminal cleavage/methylation domain-containing protein [Tepidisphaera sp.]